MDNIVTVQTSDGDLLESIKSIEGANVIPIDTKSFDGMAELVSLMVVLTPLVVREVSKVFISQIESRKNIKVIHKGTEISGLSKTEIIDILNQISTEGRKPDES